MHYTLSPATVLGVARVQLVGVNFKRVIQNGMGRFLVKSRQRFLLWHRQHPASLSGAHSTEVIRAGERNIIRKYNLIVVYLP